MSGKTTFEWERKVLNVKNDKSIGVQGVQTR